MGYRSEVRCLIYGTKQELDDYMLSQVLLSNSSVFREFKEHLVRYTIESNPGEDIHVLDLSGDSWKWYEDYPDVRAWMTFMNESTEMNLEYEFIRIGEEDGDIEKLNSDNPRWLIGTTSPSIVEDFDKLEDIPITF